MADQITLEEYKASYRNDRLAEERRFFFKNLLAYIGINAVLITINLYFFPNFWYFLFPLVGWGIGVVAHYMTAIRHGKRNLERKEEAAELEAKFFRTE